MSASLGRLDGLLLDVPDCWADSLFPVLMELLVVTICSLKRKFCKHVRNDIKSGTKQAEHGQTKATSKLHALATCCYERQASGQLCIVNKRPTCSFWSLLTQPIDPVQLCDAEQQAAMQSCGLVQQLLGMRTPRLLLCALRPLFIGLRLSPAYSLRYTGLGVGNWEAVLWLRYLYPLSLLLCQPPFALQPDEHNARHSAITTGVPGAGGETQQEVLSMM